MIERKIFPSEIKDFDDKNLIIEHFISTVTQDDGGDIMEPDGMVIRGKSVVLFQHGQDPSKGTEPIAKPVSISVGTNKDGVKGIIAKTQYYNGEHLTPPDNTGRRLYEKAKGGWMPNWSIGWEVIEYTPTANGGRHVTKWKLLEYSQVAVGMNAEATTEFQKQHASVKIEPSLMFVEDVKAVIPYAKHSLADLDAPWSSSREVAGADVSDLKIMCAWFDVGKPGTKSSYRLPHHTHNDYTTVWNGVKAAMGALLGGKVSDIPEGDRKGAYNHLAKHYKEFEKETPDFKDYTEAQVKELFSPEPTAFVKSVTARVNGQLPVNALAIIFNETMMELAAQGYGDAEKASDVVANEVMSEFIDLALPYMKAFVDSCREKPEEKEKIIKELKVFMELKKDESKPYPNEHSARVRDPDDFEEDSFRRKKIDTGISLISGKLKDGDGSMTAQAYRFSTDNFTVAEAKAWLKEHKIKYISFEEASEKSTEPNLQDTDPADPGKELVLTIKQPETLLTLKEETIVLPYESVDELKQHLSSTFASVAESVVDAKLRKLRGKLD